MLRCLRTKWSYIALQRDMAVGLQVNRHAEAIAQGFPVTAVAMTVLPDARQPYAFLGVVGKVDGLVRPGFHSVLGKGRIVLTDPAALGQVIKAPVFCRKLTQPVLLHDLCGQWRKRKYLEPSGLAAFTSKMHPGTLLLALGPTTT